ncbi:30S ribosomal protein S11 [Mycoplasma sp. (ex Biomphalaria glabrata)]|uniref:30S ribosomal protein S11 n=1 Tax=Mycoplasma sp. (ex Biomphalaria glabrata) TaxID=1749074 RepID=UPI00073AB13D|nr:30S ribosomal protein S11 [Mycoplasma sp. (ex Biomphalaria glabrata)]ALV23410.1 30S ribosomal protein S11 [Mycoplasma sp. (ex Biomphalaria glabrata)]
MAKTNNAKTVSTSEKKRKQKKFNIQKAQAHIHASFNNTIITITNEKGEAITWSSGGALGYKGSKKSTPFVAQQAAASCAKILKDYGVQEISIFVKGLGPGREAAIRGIQGTGLAVLSIKDVTSAPHNGCRAPRAPRK